MDNNRHSRRLSRGSFKRADSEVGRDSSSRLSHDHAGSSASIFSTTDLPVVESLRVRIKNLAYLSWLIANTRDETTILPLPKLRETCYLC
jgi:hypothetical protein